MKINGVRVHKTKYGANQKVKINKNNGFEIFKINGFYIVSKPGFVHRKIKKLLNDDSE